MPKLRERTPVPGWCGQTGGARGCAQRWKVSMMIMCPPQHGQGGRGSVSSTGSSGSAGGGTASSCRTRATLALRENPANASGRPFREVLQGHYDEIDPKPAEKQHHTIGPQVDPQQLEPSAPMAARQWAAD